MTAAPLVTVGMPVYNGFPWIANALDSILAQDYRHLEIVVVDNASTDDTGELCRRAAASDSRVRYVRNRENIGASRNFLRSLALAQGEFFMWAAYDDLWEPTFVSTLVARLRSDPDILLAMSQYDRFSYVTSEAGTLPGEGYPAVSSQQTVYENAKAYLRRGASELIYGMFRIEALRASRFARGSTFDWSDVSLVNEMCAAGKVHLEPTVLFHTGFTGPRPVKSIAHRRMPGLKLGYTRYLWNSSLAFMSSRRLHLREKTVLLALLARQVLGMVVANEVPPRVRTAFYSLRRRKHEFT